MGQHIKGISAVKAVTLTRAAMNPEARVVLLKSKAGRTSPTPPTTTEGEPDVAFDPKLMKSLLSLEGDAKTYAMELPDEELEAFLGKPDGERTELVTKSVAAKKEKADKDAADAAAAAAAAGTPGEVAELKKSLASMQERIDALTSGDTETKIKSLASGDYPNVPATISVPALKSIHGKSDEERAPVLALLKSQNDAAGRLSQAFSGVTEIAPGSAQAEYEGKVEEVSKARSISKSQARLAMANETEFAPLIQRVRDEELEAA